jgi:hypothetical protein
MTRTLLAAALLVAASSAGAADAPQIPKPQCEPIPQAPGMAMRSEELAMKRFKREVDRYEKCMKAYVDEHQALAKANNEAANAAADEYNKTINDINKQLKGD